MDRHDWEEDKLAYEERTDPTILIHCLIGNLSNYVCDTGVIGLCLPNHSWLLMCPLATASQLAARTNVLHPEIPNCR